MTAYVPPPAHRETASRGTLWDMHYLDDLRHDPWGTAMSTAGALCDALAAQGEWDAIPSGLGYSPGLHVRNGLPIDPEDFHAYQYAVALADGSLTLDAAEHALRVLDRYLDVVRRAGRDY